MKSQNKNVARGVNILALKKLSADEEFKAEYEYWLKYEREKYLHGKKGFQEGLEVKAIEDVINLIKETGWSLDKAMTVLKVDASYKAQIEAKLEELGIKYNY